MEDFDSSFDSDADGVLRRLRASSTTQSDEWDAYAAELLGKMSDGELLRLTHDVAAHKFAPLNPKFIQACITVQIGRESQRRLAAVGERLANLDDDPLAP